MQWHSYILKCGFSVYCRRWFNPKHLTAHSLPWLSSRSNLRLSVLLKGTMMIIHISLQGFDHTTFHLPAHIFHTVYLKMTENFTIWCSLTNYFSKNIDLVECSGLHHCNICIMNCVWPIPSCIYLMVNSHLHTVITRYVLILMQCWQTTRLDNDKVTLTSHFIYTEPRTIKLMGLDLCLSIFLTCINCEIIA